MLCVSAIRSQRGQATPEWLGLVLLVALAMAALAAAGVRVPGAALGVVIAERIACAAGIGGGCGEVGELQLTYGPEVAGALEDHAPLLDYERGMRALPVDYRSCREDGCAEGPAEGPVTESLAGEPVTAFVHVVDCRDAAAPTPGADCSGDRAGFLYLQYWLYYPGSSTRTWGEAGSHPDDFESFQVRIGPDGRAESRASSHHGYNGRSGSWLSDTGVVGAAAWTDDTGRYAISGGSHAGRVGSGLPPSRWTEPGAIRLIPIESMGDPPRGRFAVSPPWEKDVYVDPEAKGTG